MSHAIPAALPRLCAALGTVALVLLAPPLHAQTDPPHEPPPIAGSVAALDTATITTFTLLRSRATQSDRKVRVIARLSQAAVGGGAMNQPVKVTGETTELRQARDRRGLYRRFVPGLDQAGQQCGNRPDSGDRQQLVSTP